MHDQRIIDIESKLAYQEDLLGQLNSALSDQQAQLLDLHSLCQSLIERVRSMAEGALAVEASDERPPHY